jgi:5-methylcytosine-specific restriction endonuclease McrA
MMILQKVCSKCGIVKSFAEFRKNKRSSDGFTASCSECCRKHEKEYYKRATTAFITRTKKYADSHPEKRYLWQKEWRQRNPEKIKVSKAKERKNHPEKGQYESRLRRARILLAPGNGVTAEQWKYILTFYGNKCLKCGTTKNITADHVIPLVKGGAHDMTNIQPLCKSCNSSKHSSIIDYRFIADWT